MKKFLVFICLIFLVVPLFFSQSVIATASSGVIKIGVIEPISGEFSFAGQQELNGIRIANKLYPIVLGKKIQLVIADNKSDKNESINAASKLSNDKVNAVIGSWGSSLSIAAGDVFKNAKIPAVSATATNPILTKENNYYFRSGFLDSYQGTVMAKYAFNTLKAKKVAILQDPLNVYSTDISAYFIDQMKKLTGDPNCILELAKYNEGDKNFSSQLLKIKAKNPDVIFIPGNYEESALIINQARSLGIKVQFLGDDLWQNPSFINIGKNSVENVVFPVYFDETKPLTDEATKFIAEYEKTYKLTPTFYAANAYDAYLIILNAIKNANSTDTVNIRNTIAKTTNLKGVTGYITLDAYGDPIKDVPIQTVKNGKFIYKDVVRAR